MPVLDRTTSILFVIAAWGVAPILKRTVLDYMLLADKASPVRAFVALNSIGCTLAATALAYSTEPMQFVQRIPSVGWAALLAGVLLGTACSIVLMGLLSSGNPGETMVYLNAGTNVLPYVLGAVLYDKLSWASTVGVLLIAVGGTLIS